jgi:large subunit ribosomal protein L20
MARSKFAVASRNKRKKYLKAAKGFRAGRGKLIRTVKETVERGWAYAFRDRRIKKRDFRSLWIVRINAGVRPLGLSYSAFIRGLGKAGVTINRKVLADLAVSDPAALAQLVAQAKTALAQLAGPAKKSK